MTIIYVYNQSTVVTNTDVAYMVQANNFYVALFCKTWNREAPSIKFITTPLPPVSKRDPHAWYFLITDTTTEAGALAYHTEESGIVDGYVFAKTILDNKGVVLWKDSKTDTVASALCHEILETICDPNCNGWWSLDNGSYVASEVCDPVQDQMVPVPITIAPNHAITVGLSDFITPAWMDAEAKSGPFNFLNNLKHPFTLTQGGYAVVADSKGNITYVTGKDTNVSKVETKGSTQLSRIGFKGKSCSIKTSDQTECSLLTL